MKEIRLLHGQIALIDDEDYELVRQLEWHLHSEGYAVATKSKPGGGKTVIWMHRLVLGIETDADHRDGNRLNNQKYNLRPVTDSQNAGNRRIILDPSKTSKFKGVYWHKGKQRWRATIKAQCAGLNRQKYIGQFKEEIEAARAYNLEAVQLFGEFAHLNPV